MLTRDIISNEIALFVTEYDAKGRLTDKWRTPLIGFADAVNPGFTKLRELVHAQHELPDSVLPGAKIVLSYFVPFTNKIAEGNKLAGLASPEWAEAYEATNAMFRSLNTHLITFLGANGYRAAVPQTSAYFDKENITSRWSQRHIAYLAGLGTFGLNNMLITDAGCCGRFNSVVTDLDLLPDKPLKSENCLYKLDGRCAVCANRCPTGALTVSGFDRRVCYGRCMENAKVYTQFGSSYASKAGGQADDLGSDVCGKCVVGLPCSMKKPVPF